ncbi:MAG: hypothetical protein HY735_06865 [Verrucomicrobia bacterium]|nr:hypothetical protein [Verrucomicrobiota bacterium]
MTSTTFTLFVEGGEAAGIVKAAGRFVTKPVARTATADAQSIRPRAGQAGNFDQGSLRSMVRFE